ncbi:MULTISPECIES: xanthine dehydrogenase family protein subunit M [unclassified Streptomyces]|uniref:FAD binding domain-containing protein n=1 Tax=unclassified Streptomyces TaxID=2593676 RepID=UPI00225B36F5|nr:xanthine dehydrogenase family protein subunit M [Streptomyces sp. NBC_00063]MCX5442899.1 xanthine dehydrogenase family protein subunit M [Streptomyces sp. NBC_00063]
MRPISYSRAADVAGAIATVSSDPTSDFLAGGTTEVDLLRQNVLLPRRLVDINDLPLTQIEDRPDGGLYIGALARMSAVAESAMVRERFPVIAQALVLGATAQLRHMASMGGNMMQRTRCGYFRDGASPCNKREPGSGCSALDGFNRGHGVLGVSDHCIATHPSDVAVPLMALDARIHTEGPHGRQVYAIDDFFLQPGDTPHLEHPLEHAELVVGIEVPGLSAARTSLYLKVRDRESYEFALTSVAAVVPMADGVIGDVRLALGGVATKPWRARRAEEILRGSPADSETFARAAREELTPARTTQLNAFKVELAQRTMVRALETLTKTGSPS